MPRRNISISMRLTAWFGGIFLVGWLMFGATMWAVLKTTLSSERHQTLTRRLDRVQEFLRKRNDQTDEERIQDLREFASATGNGLIEILRPDGTHATPALSTAAQSFAWPDVSELQDQRFVHVISSGQYYSVLERRDTIGTQPVMLLAAAPEAGNLLVLDSFVRGLAAAAPILLLVSMAGGYWTSRRALHPVDRITAAARSIGIRNLSERLPVENTSDELQRLAETCNDMLERLEIAVRKLRQFTADASHELRGPLSLTRTIAEVGLRNPGIDASSRGSMQEIVEEGIRASLLLEQMLELARADTEPLDMVLEPVDLVALVQESCAQASLIAKEKNLTVRFAGGMQPTVPIVGHATSLRRLIWIMLDNAIKYTVPPGIIDVSLTTNGPSTIVLIQDTGIGISSSDLPHIFDRFYRADLSRSQVEGSGLGLSIAKWIAEKHRAEIAVASSEGTGSAFSIIFPTLPKT
jgi:signal transduction histidine kinase